MKKITVLCLVTLANVAFLLGQDAGTERPTPNIDEIVEFLALEPSQIDCLETNRAALADALSPTREQLRDLQAELRLTTRNGQDTTGIQAEIDSLKAAAESTKTTYTASAQACLTADQATAVGALVQAETLMNEVRQGKGLLLLEGTEEGVGEGDRRRRGAPRGRR